MRMTWIDIRVDRTDEKIAEQYVYREEANGQIMHVRDKL